MLTVAKASGKNAKTADFQYVTMPNLLLRINPVGQIEYMLRYHTVFGP